MNKRIVDWMMSFLETWAGADARDAARQFLTIPLFNLDEQGEIIENYVTEIVRAVLRQHDADGVPLFVNVTQMDDEGNVARAYVPTKDATRAQMRNAVNLRIGIVTSNAKTIRSMAKKYQERFGEQLPLPGFIAQIPDQTPTIVPVPAEDDAAQQAAS